MRAVYPHGVSLPVRIANDAHFVEQFREHLCVLFENHRISVSRQDKHIYLLDAVCSACECSPCQYLFRVLRSPRPNVQLRMLSPARDWSMERHARHRARTNQERSHVMMNSRCRSVCQEGNAKHQCFDHACTQNASEHWPNPLLLVTRICFPTCFPRMHIRARSIALSAGLDLYPYPQPLPVHG